MIRPNVGLYNEVSIETQSYSVADYLRDPAL